MSRGDAVPDIGGVDPIVVKIVKGGVSVWMTIAARKTKKDLDPADHLRTLKSVRILSGCARRCHLSVAILVAKGSWLIVPAVSARNCTVLTVPVVLSVKAVKRYWPSLAVNIAVGIWR